jgi:prepilin-type N-terminal cleavage/methylation domain-containing protein
MIKRGGFTFIELLVAIAIIGILAVLIIVQVTGAQVRSRNSSAKSDISQIGKSIGIESTNNANLSDRYYQSDPRASAAQAGTRISGSGPGQGLWTTFFGTSSSDGGYNKLRISRTPSSDYEYGYITDVSTSPGTANALAYCIATSVTTASTVTDTAFYVNNGTSGSSASVIPTYNTTGKCQ